MVVDIDQYAWLFSLPLVATAAVGCVWVRRRGREGREARELRESREWRDTRARERVRESGLDQLRIEQAIAISIREQ
ncbi:hypothetical protein T484DRAFT_2903432 [Baffinella frigidus]|nr:hypothetical protein T484DRAFT_2903432 [Cryptophyta sp. CCMP2293]